MEAKGDVEGLVKSLNYRRKDSHVRGRAAGALGKIGDSRAVKPLIAALKDRNWSVRWRPVEALRKIGPACPFSQ